MNTPHTPGPWVLQDQKNGHYIIGRIDPQENAAVSFNKANATLIAAAPELLEALKLALATIRRVTKDHGHSFNSTQGTRDVISAAIANAEGRTV